jgi:hypothetical protein
MKMKHIKLKLVILTAIFMVSTSTTTLGMSTLKMNENVVISDIDDEFDCGSLTISGDPGQTQYHSYYASAHASYTDADVGTGSTVKLTVDYLVYATGSCDTEHLKIYLDGNEVATKDFLDDQNKEHTGELCAEVYMEPGTTYTVIIYIYWEDGDYLGNRWRVDNVPPKTDTLTITTAPYVADLVIPETASAGNRREKTTATWSFKIKNAGIKTLEWEIVSVTCTNRDDYPFHPDNNFILRYDPEDGDVEKGDDYDTVTLSFYVPSWAEHPNKFKWDIKITSNGANGGSGTVEASLGVDFHAKSTDKLLPFNTDFLQTRFPQLFALLQRLDVFN